MLFQRRHFKRYVSITWRFFRAKKIALSMEFIQDSSSQLQALRSKGNIFGIGGSPMGVLKGERPFEKGTLLIDSVQRPSFYVPSLFFWYC